MMRSAQLARQMTRQMATTTRQASGVATHVKPTGYGQYMPGETYPVIAVIAGACILCGGKSLHYVSTSPDITWTPARRGAEAGGGRHTNRPEKYGAYYSHQNDNFFSKKSGTVFFRNSKLTHHECKDRDLDAKIFE